MRVWDYLEIHAGGPGSGRHPEGGVREPVKGNVKKGETLKGTNGNFYTVSSVHRDHIKVSGGSTGVFKVKYEDLPRNFVEFGAKESNVPAERVVERAR